jgi:hypothetical protein
MRHITTLSGLVLLASITYASTATADWRSLLKEATTVGTDLLSDQVASSNAASLDNNTLISGLKQALDIGTRNAIENVGQPGGYMANDLIRIPLPPALDKVSSLMRQVGLSAQADQFEQSINRAAEKAALQAKEILLSAIQNMSIDDATKVLNGSDNAATEYFKTQTSAQLTQLFKPTIQSSLNNAGSTKYYNDLSQKIAAVPIVGQQVNVDLPDYVTQQALEGLFAVIALEEKKIRENPAARTTELLKKVFK